MTHFIGAVVLPKTVQYFVNAKPTPYPTLYGAEAKDIVPGTSLNDALHEALAQFDENREVNIWQPKRDMIRKAREDIESYRDGTYADYIADPAAYREKYSHASPEHFEYLATEFPKKMAWTDDEVYADVIKWEEPEDIRAEDGAIRTSYNPESRWDWWTIGGRWESQYREKQGIKVGEYLKDLEQTLADFDANKNLRPPVSEDDIFADTERKLPWWFPHNFVTREADVVAVDEETQQLTGHLWHRAGRMGWFGMKSDDMTERDWIVKSIEILTAKDAEDFIVFVDFHI